MKIKDIEGLEEFVHDMAEAFRRPLTEIAALEVHTEKNTKDIQTLVDTIRTQIDMLKNLHNNVNVQADYVKSLDVRIDGLIDALIKDRVKEEPQRPLLVRAFIWIKEWLS